MNARLVTATTLMLIAASAAPAPAAAAAPERPDLPDLDPPCRAQVVPERPLFCGGIHCVQVYPWSLLCAGDVIGFLRAVLGALHPKDLVNLDGILST